MKKKIGPCIASSLLGSFILFQQLTAHASALTPLPLSYGALLYDIYFPNGPGSHASINAGQWASSIAAFNTGAQSKNLITRLYPYSADIEITCSDVNNITTCNIVPGYATGSASVQAYRSAFPNATIMPIVDISFHYLNNSLLKTNTTLADNVAKSLVTQLCADTNVNGVLFDLETSDAVSSPGLFEFYRKMSTMLASSACIDSTHPKGRYMGIYLTPVGNDWATTQAIFAGNNNGYLAIPLYDVSAFSTPPKPDALSLYNGYVTSAVGHAKTNATQYKVPYSVITPAGASFGTFESYGIYNASEPAPTYFQLITDYSKTNATQLAFVQNVRNVTCLNQNPYFMGMDYWSWTQYISPGTSGGNYELVMPNTPDSKTVTYLQANASCQ